MVKAARKKNPSARIEIQSATDFKANSKVDLITCTFDVLNHLENKEKIKTFFKRSFFELQQGGFLIFDSLAPDDINNNWNGYVEVDSWEDLFLIRRGKKLSNGKGILKKQNYFSMNIQKILSNKSLLRYLNRINPGGVYSKSEFNFEESYLMPKSDFPGIFFHLVTLSLDELKDAAIAL
jgi:hypothetical protein